jgi:hypothetical protein
MKIKKRVDGRHDKTCGDCENWRAADSSATWCVAKIPMWAMPINIKSKNTGALDATNCQCFEEKRR